MKKIVYILVLIFFNLNVSFSSESRFGELTFFEDVEMRGKNDQWIRPHPGPFVWGSIEKEKGIFNWNQADKIKKYSQEHNQSILATIWPYADWDQKTCKRRKSRSPFRVEGGFPKYLGKPCSMENYFIFLSALIDRYDGDGKNDMPGLKNPITHWEIMNEPEFKRFLTGKKDAFVEIFNATSKLIKKKQKQSVVFMAGSAGMFPENKQYWNYILPKISEHFDVANIHHIPFKNGNCDKEMWVDEFEKLLKKKEIQKPIWVTEAQTGNCNVINSYIKTFLSGAEVIIDVGVNAPGRKMSKKGRIKLNNLIKNYDGFKSIKLKSKNEVEFKYKDGSSKSLDF